MRTLMGIAVGLLLGVAVTLALSPMQAEGMRITTVRGINHVGLNVDNFEESVAFYTQKLGFREVERENNDKGEVARVFLQAGPRTFLEVSPATANRPAGLTHFGLQVDSMPGVLGTLKERGVNGSEARSVGTQWMISSVTAPGSRIELVELGPESPLEKAAVSWGK